MHSCGSKPRPHSDDTVLLTNIRTLCSFGGTKRTAQARQSLPDQGPSFERRIDGDHTAIDIECPLKCRALRKQNTTAFRCALCNQPGGLYRVKNQPRDSFGAGGAPYGHTSLKRRRLAHPTIGLASQLVHQTTSRDVRSGPRWGGKQILLPCRPGNRC